MGRIGLGRIGLQARAGAEGCRLRRVGSQARPKVGPRAPLRCCPRAHITLTSRTLTLALSLSLPLTPIPTSAMLPACNSPNPNPGPRDPDH